MWRKGALKAIATIVQNRIIHTRAAQHIAALIIYVLLGIGMTWPLAAHWNTAVVGGPEGFVYPGFEDASQNVWNIWWVRRALELGLNPFWTPILYYPEGVQMYLQTMNLPDALITLPINYLAGPIAAYNAAVLLAYALTGYAGFLAARMFTSHTTIALICGALLTASPFHMVRMQVNHLNLISMQWVVFAIIGIVQVERRSDFTAIAAITAAVGSLTSWYWALAIGLFATLWCVLSVACSRERLVLLKRYMIVAGIWLLLLSPVLIGVAHLAERSLTYKPSEDYTRAYSADMFGLFYPSALGQAWGSQMQDIIRRVAPSSYSPDGWYAAGMCCDRNMARLAHSLAINRCRSRRMAVRSRSVASHLGARYGHSASLHAHCGSATHQCGSQTCDPGGCRYCHTVNVCCNRT
jgi:hypothetical protein